LTPLQNVDRRGNSGGSHQWRAVFLAIIFFLALCARAHASDSSDTKDGYVRKNFTVEDGLLSNSIDAIVQTRDGFLWVGTKEGLLRFDGRHFTAISLLPQASPVSVSALAVAPDGALWVGSRSGVARLAIGEPSDFGHIASAVYHPGTGDGDSIQCLHFTRKGELFAGTMTGLYRLNRERFSVVIPELWTSRIDEAANGNLLVITSKGFVEWDGKQVIQHPDLPARLGVRQNEIFEVSEDHAGARWYCSTAGLARQIGASIERIGPYGGNVVFRVNEDAQGRAWYAQAGNLYRVGRTGPELIAADLRATYLAFDRDGDIWAATKGTGLFKLKRQAVKMFTMADGLPFGVPTAVLATSDGKLWVGSNCGGLSWFDGVRFRSYFERHGLTNSCIFSLAEDRNHDILIGTFSGGVFRYREGQFTQIVKEDKLKNNVAVAFLPADDGSLWIPYSDGLSRIQDGHIRKFTTADGLSSNSLLSGYIDKRGVFWVETTGGIDRLEKDRFVAVSKTSNTAVGEGGFGFGEDQSGALFAFGPFAGTFRVQEDRVSKLQGVPKITGMLKSAKNLWFCGDGIYRTSLGSLERWEHLRDTPPDYTRFDRADGMSSTACSGGFRNMAMTNDGKLWVATEQGVAALEPSQLRHTDHKAAAYIEKIVIGANTQSPGRELILQPGTHHVEIHFAAIEVASPEAIRFQYRLDGVDREWLAADSNVTAVYNGFPVGAHTFHVRATNSDGVWDPVGIGYNVTQKPYFYETIAFRLALLGIIVLLLAASYQLRLRRITAQMDARLDERVAERTRLARDLHDTMLQTIQASQMIAAEAVEQAGDPIRTRATLERLSDWLTQAHQEARASLLALRVSTTQTNDLAEALERLGNESATRYSLHFRLLIEGRVKYMHPIVRDEIYRIGSEAIRNACCHSAGTKVEASLSYSHNLELRVRDDGRGIDSEIAAKGKRGHFGLTGMQERAARINAKLTISSSANAGTEVRLVVPGQVIFRDQGCCGEV
jgi:signal transduction histidine kinase/ligand-binding sensor domain-containing protein